MRTFLIIFWGVDAFGALVVRLLVYLNLVHLSLVYPQPVLALMLVLRLVLMLR